MQSAPGASVNDSNRYESIGSETQTTPKDLIKSLKVSEMVNFMGKDVRLDSTPYSYLLQSALNV